MNHWNNSNKIVYTANDEEPNCGNCDFFSSGAPKPYGAKPDEDGCDYCGPKGGWCYYRRTDYKKLKERWFSK